MIKFSKNRKIADIRFGKDKQVNKIYFCEPGTKVMRKIWARGSTPVLEPSLSNSGSWKRVYIEYTPTVNETVTSISVFTDSIEWGYSNPTGYIVGADNTILAKGTLSFTKSVSRFNISSCDKLTATFTDGYQLTAGTTYYFIVADLYREFVLYYDVNEVTKCNYRGVDSIGYDWAISNKSVGTVINDNALPATVYTDKSYYYEMEKE